MPIVIGKSVNFLLAKLTPKAGQIYPQLRIPAIDVFKLNRLLSVKFIKSWKYTKVVEGRQDN